MIAWITVAFVAIGLGLYLQNEIGLAIVGTGALGLITGLLAERKFGRILIVKKIDTRYIWLLGASPAFLAELPEWPGSKN